MFSYPASSAFSSLRLLAGSSSFAPIIRFSRFSGPRQELVVRALTSMVWSRLGFESALSSSSSTGEAFSALLTPVELGFFQENFQV